jgi:hypothetical protein
MKGKLVIMAALALAASAQPLGAQPPDEAATVAQRAAMQRLDWMNGRWRGPAVTMTAAGEQRVIQTERIGAALDGTLKVLEGKGFRPNGQVGFHAFGIISYDAATQRYNLHSHAQGRVGDFPLTITPDGYVWEIPIGPARIRYTATLHDGTWREVGERITPGGAPQQFFEMNLVRLGDTDWPEAGAATAP